MQILTRREDLGRNLMKAKPITWPEDMKGGKGWSEERHEFCDNRTRLRDRKSCFQNQEPKSNQLGSRTQNLLSLVTIGKGITYINSSIH